MNQSPVFDFVPYGGMMESFDDEELRPVLIESVENGDPPGKTFDKLKEEQIIQLRNNVGFQDKLRDIYSGAGVNLITPTMMSHDPNVPFHLGVIEDISRWHARMELLDWLVPVTSPEKALEVAKQEKVGVILNTQDLGRAIEGDVFDVRNLFNFGLRIGQITYNAQNILGSGCYERSNGRLSHKGVRTIREMNELGFIIDLSHCGKQTTLDTISASESPVSFTHTFGNHSIDNNRGKSDEVMQALADADGYMGIQVTPSHISPGKEEEAFEMFFKHLDHAISILGIDNVGIGTDFGFGPSKDVPAKLREGMRDRIQSRRITNSSAPKAKVSTGFGPIGTYKEFGMMAEELADRGYSSKEVKKIRGANFVEFWKRV